MQSLKNHDFSKYTNALQKGEDEEGGKNGGREREGGGVAVFMPGKKIRLHCGPGR